MPELMTDSDETSNQKKKKNLNPHWTRAEVEKDVMAVRSAPRIAARLGIESGEPLPGPEDSEAECQQSYHKICLVTKRTEKCIER